MVWFYRNGKGELRIETRFNDHTGEYVLDLAWPGQPMVTERFTDEQAFRARTIALEQQLDAEHWKQVGSPEILPHGWRGPMH
jgi:hypothetical protein